MISGVRKLTGSADFTFTKDWHARVDFTYNLNYSRSAEHRKKVDMITNAFVETEGNTNNNSYSWVNGNKDYYSFNAYTDYEHTFALCKSHVRFQSGID